MLVLSRKKNETIVIDTDKGLVEVTVVEVRGDTVRIGIMAPREIPVHRREVYQSLQNQGKKYKDGRTGTRETNPTIVDSPLAKHLPEKKDADSI